MTSHLLPAIFLNSDSSIKDNSGKDSSSSNNGITTDMRMSLSALLCGTFSRFPKPFFFFAIGSETFGMLGISFGFVLICSVLSAI
jgi:hypothetical protein